MRDKPRGPRTSSDDTAYARRVCEIIYNALPPPIYKTSRTAGDDIDNDAPKRTHSETTLNERRSCRAVS